MGRPLIYNKKDVLEKVYQAKPNLIFNDTYTKYSEKHHWECKNHPNIDIFRSPKHLIERHSVGCPICNHKISKKTDEEAFDVCFPELMRHWDFSKNIGVSPNNFTKSSEFSMFWECDKKHSFNSKIKDVVNNYLQTGRFYCPYCENNKVLIGFNDLWTTHPHIAKLLADPNDGYKYTYGSGVKVKWRCSECGQITQPLAICDVVRYGHISCPKCSDGISLPEKIMANILTQLDLDFIWQVSSSYFEWCKNFRYDFYIKDYDIIIETHGGQHYKNTGNFKKSLREEQENDRNKYLLAEQYVKDYIVVDCRISSFDYIKNSILNSKLLNIFDLSKIDWTLCELNAYKSMICEVCNKYNLGMSTSEIEKDLKLSKTTVCKYLNKGTKLKLCNYDNNALRINNHYKKMVYCKTTNKIFDSVRCASKYYNIRENGISTCANGGSSYSGKYNGLKLVWSFILPSNYNEEDVICNI